MLSWHTHTHFVNTWQYFCLLMFSQSPKGMLFSEIGVAATKRLIYTKLRTFHFCSNVAEHLHLVNVSDYCEWGVFLLWSETIYRKRVGCLTTFPSAASHSPGFEHGQEGGPETQSVHSVLPIKQIWGSRLRLGGPSQVPQPTLRWRIWLHHMFFKFVCFTHHVRDPLGAGAVYWAQRTGPLWQRSTAQLPSLLCRLSVHPDKKQGHKKC